MIRLVPVVRCRDGHHRAGPVLVPDPVFAIVVMPEPIRMLLRLQEVRGAAFWVPRPRVVVGAGPVPLRVVFGIWESLEVIGERVLPVGPRGTLEVWQFGPEEVRVP